MKYYVECTNTVASTWNSGIQRVVRNLIKHSIDSPERDVVPVIFQSNWFVPIDGDMPLGGAFQNNDAERKAGNAAHLESRPTVGTRIKVYLRNLYNAGRSFLVALIPNRSFASFVQAPSTRFGLTWVFLKAGVGLFRQRGKHPTNGISAVRPVGEDRAVHAAKGDVLVLLDASWHLDIWEAVLDFRRHGGVVVFVCYDLIPNSHPQFCGKDHVEVFNAWISRAMRRADVFMCISRSTAEILHASARQIAPERRRMPRMSYFWLGSELEGFQTRKMGVRTEISDIVSNGKPAYIYVSTIEPRKNHSYCLDAFELLWQSGIDATITIVGRIGWRCEDFVNRVMNHEEIGRRLFMVNDADDEELTWLYEKARGLLFTSFIEGFGLPITEALQHGLPVFASDIPVFREIADEGVTFVDLQTPASLADALKTHIAADSPRLLKPVPWLTWGESTQQFWDRLDNCLSATPDPSVMVPQIYAAKIIQNTLSQEVQLPADIWLDNPDVEMFRRGDEVVIREKSASGAYPKA